jgi:hypothetical protein
MVEVASLPLHRLMLQCLPFEAFVASHLALISICGDDFRFSHRREEYPTARQGDPRAGGCGRHATMI